MGTSIYPVGSAGLVLPISYHPDYPVTCFSSSLFYHVGVPLSTQWGQQGYFYPIQIAQYGLTHYCKNLTDRTPRMTVFENAEGHDLSSWSSSDPHAELKIVQDDEQASRVLEYKTPRKYEWCIVWCSGVWGGGGGGGLNSRSKKSPAFIRWTLKPKRH